MPVERRAPFFTPLAPLAPLAALAVFATAVCGCSGASPRMFGVYDGGGDVPDRKGGTAGTLQVGRPEAGTAGSGGLPGSGGKDGIVGSGGVTASGGTGVSPGTGGNGTGGIGSGGGTSTGGNSAGSGGTMARGTGGAATGGSGTGGLVPATGGRGTGGAGTGGASTGGAGTGGAGTGGMAPPTLDGSSPERAGGSCREILAITGAHTDGVFWIRPDPGSAVRRVFCDMTSDGGGWTMVFKLNDGLTGDAAVLWSGAAMNEGQLDLLGRGKSNQNYVSSLIAQNWNVGVFGVREVLLHFYVGGRLGAFAKFDGKLTTPKTWFEKNLLLASSWSDLTPTATTNVFGIVGDEHFIRHFFANRVYGECPADVGWFLVGNGWYCAWETPVPQAGPALGPLSLVYSSLPTAVVWSGIGRARADVFAVYVR